MTEFTRDTRGGGELVALVLAWVVVGVPAIWGVAQTVIKSLALLR